jgi:cytochrome c-type biogenesis protein CcsB
MIMKYIKFLFSPVFMGVLFVVFAVAMAAATFIENDFGSSAAYSMVYNTRWFELILLLLAVNLVGRLIILKLYKRDKLVVALFHLSFIIMIVGAGITRYFGWEGSIHIREGEVQNTCYSTEKYIEYSVRDASGKITATKTEKYSMTNVSADNYKKSIDINGKTYDLELSKIIPNAVEVDAVGDAPKAIAVNPAEQNTGQNAFIFHLVNGSESSTVYLWDRASVKVATGTCKVDGATVEISYGSMSIELPFSIKLNDFILERYPGSSSPSGYKSDVVLLDKAVNIQKPYVIFMNNILKYKGYRFYQSSYDQDEKGTILSVNHDMAGMLVTYTGYGLLFLFIILALLSKETVFRNVNASYWQSKIRKSIPMVILIMLLSGLTTINAQKLVPDKAVSEEFGKVLIQDQKGRTKPLFTLSNDILRKVSRSNDFDGLSSMQVFLGLYLDFNNWKDVQLITVGNKDLQAKIGIKGSMASFSDIVKLDGSGAYKISEEVNAAYAKAPADRNKMDKEVMKIDERVNIVYEIFKGDFLKLFPLKDSSNTWGSSQEALMRPRSREDSLYLAGIVPTIADALQTNNMATIRRVSASVSEYQKRFAGYNLPTQSKIKAELLYYRLGIFEKLFPFYATVGLIMLIGLITMVIKGRKETTLFVKVLGWLLFAGFMFHTLGLGLRWYIAGRSPMSNGYESMIFISWVTLLAGFIFSRRSAFALSATAVLASMTLMVAHLSFMDPEITNLVPVLKSYWLTLHVSVITGSYGFLGLGAILGLINMILMALSNEKNISRIAITIDELTVINYKTLTLGLYFLTIGTFLGAVWANESWGRYWGWDPKETWSLITIIMYSIVIHSRTIPGMKDIFTFNLISLFAFSSVLMTYFGVNYYLSGMHSYASGDPVPVPSFVYIAVVVLAALSLFSYYKYSGNKEKR